MCPHCGVTEFIDFSYSFLDIIASRRFRSARSMTMPRVGDEGKLVFGMVVNVKHILFIQTDLAKTDECQRLLRPSVAETSYRSST